MEDNFLLDEVEIINKQIESLRKAHLYEYANAHKEELDKILSGIVLLEKEKEFSLKRSFMRDGIIKQIIALDSKYVSEYLPEIEEINQKYNELRLNLELKSLKFNLDKETTEKSFEKLNEIYDTWVKELHSTTEKQVTEEKIADVTYDILIEQARKEKQVDLNYVKNIEMLLDRIKQEFYKKAEECKTKNDEKGDLYYNEFAQGIDLDNIIEPKIWEELTGIKDVQVKDFDRKKILEKEEDNVLPVKVEKKRTI